MYLLWVSSRCSGSQRTSFVLTTCPEHVLNSALEGCYTPPKITEWFCLSLSCFTDKESFSLFHITTQIFNIIKVRTKHKPSACLNQNVCVSTFKISVVKLFMATSLQQVFFRNRGMESGRMNEGGSLHLIVCLPKHCVFFQRLESWTEEAVSPLGSASVAFFQRSLFNWWTLSGLRVHGELFVVRLCSFLWINLCPF